MERNEIKSRKTAGLLAKENKRCCQERNWTGKGSKWGRSMQEGCSKGRTQSRDFQSNSSESSTTWDSAQWEEQWLDNTRTPSVKVYISTSIRSFSLQSVFPSRSSPPYLALCHAASFPFHRLQAVSISPSCHRLVQVISWLLRLNFSLPIIKGAKQKNVPFQSAWWLCTEFISMCILMLDVLPQIGHCCPQVIGLRVFHWVWSSHYLL